jgi:type I restriction enzyme S subunit
MDTMTQSLDLKNIDKSNWETYRFEEIAKRVSESVDPNTTDLKVYVGLEHIDADNIHIKRFGTPDDVSGGKLKCYPGDVIFGKRRAYQRKAAVVEFEGICSAHAFVFRANAKVIDPNLFPFFLHSDQFMHRMVDISVGGLSPTINWGDLKHQEFLLPPKAQQSQLAELLWAMDEVVEREKEVLEANSVVLNCFVEDVIHGRYLNNDSIKKTSIGNIPSSWDVVKMEKVLTINDGAHFTPTYTSEGIPFLRVTDVQSVNIDLAKVKYIPRDEHEILCKRCKPEKGDILYSKNGTIGISKIIDWDWEFSIFVSLALLKIKDKRVLDINYLKLILDSAHIKKEIYRRAKHGTITNLHLEEIRVFRLPLPKIEKQREIALKVQLINELINSCEDKISATQSLQKSLINQIF